MTLQPGDPDFEAKYLAELKALVAKQGDVIAQLTETQERHNATNRACLAQRDAALLEVTRLRGLVYRAVSMLEARSDRAARLEWATNLRKELGE
jgi:hypothetical protein